MRSPPLIFFLVATCGALCGLKANISWVQGAGICFTLFLVPFFIKSRLFQALFVCLGLFALLFTATSIQRQQFDENLLWLTSEPQIYEGTILELSDSLNGERNGKLLITSASSTVLQREFTLSIRIASAASAVFLQVGDRIRIKGKIKKAHHALSPTEFDTYWFGLARGVVGRIIIREPHLIAVVNRDSEPSLLARAQEGLRKNILRYVSPREAGLLLALIVGDVNFFDDEQKAEYRNIGAAHLLAVSGLQVSMLGTIFYRLFLFLFLLVPWLWRHSLSRLASVLLTIVLIWGFVSLCNMPPSAVRAGLMTTLLLLCSTYGWKTSSIDVLGASGLIIITFSPLSVLDPSLWLSFAAVFGLILAASVCKVSEKNILLLSPEQSSSSFREKAYATCVSSLGAGLLTLPFSIFYFGEIAPSGLFINMLLVPVANYFQAPAILCSGIGVSLGVDWLVHLGAFFAGALDAMCLTLYDLFGRSILLEPISLISLFFAVLATMFLIALANQKDVIKKLIVASICMASIIFPLEKNDELRVTFLPIGQGDSTIIEIPKGGLMVVDGGGDFENKYNPGEKIITPYLRRRGVEVIDVLALSHPDADHLMGLLPLIENFKVKELWHAEQDDAHPLMKKLLEVAELRGVLVRSVNALPEKIVFNDTIVQFSKYQARGMGNRKTNNRSLVFRIEYEGKSVLLTGDIESLAEEEILESGFNLPSTVVKAAHHGSKTSSSEAFVTASKAKHVVFSTGVENKFGFPHAEVVERWKKAGASLWNTAVHGQTTFILGKNVERVIPYLHPAT